MKNFAIIVAVDLENGIGKNNGLPWHLPSELKHFSMLTKTTQDPAKKNAVIMGRNTWESLPDKFKPLPGRLNVVLSSNPALKLPDSVITTTSLDEALAKMEKMEEIEQIYVIGGAKVYEFAVKHPACATIYLTQIESKLDCDTFFPSIDQKKFQLLSTSENYHEKGLNYRYLIYGV